VRQCSTHRMSQIEYVELYKPPKCQMAVVPNCQTVEVLACRIQRGLPHFVSRRIKLYINCNVKIWCWKRQQSDANKWQTTLAHPRAFRFFSWLSSCALAQHSVTRTKNFSSHPRPAPARIPVRAPAPAQQMWVPVTRPAQDSILQSGWLKLYGEIK